MSEQVIEQQAPAAMPTPTEEVRTRAAEALDSLAETILSRWLTRMRDTIPSVTVDVATPEVLDSMLAVIRGIAEGLRRGEMAAEAAVWTQAATRHADTRRSQHEPLGDLIREYQLLREGIWLALRTYMGAVPLTDVFDLAWAIDRGIDTVATIATATYGNEVQRALDRTARLQRVSAAFVPTLSVEEVARVIISQGIGALDGMGGLLALFSEDRTTLQVVESIGLRPELEAGARHLARNAPRPLVDAIRSGQAQWFADLDALRSTYPALADLVALAGYGAWAVLPLRSDNRALGAIALGFHGPRTFSAEDRSLALTVAQLSASALQRAQLFEAERRARQEWVDTLESISDAFLALDHEARVTYVNRQGERLSGLKREEMLGRSVWDVFPEAVRLPFYEQYRRGVAEKVATSYEAPYPPLGIWLQVRSYPSPHGRSVFFTDITERKRAEEALRESETRFRSLFENSIDAVLLTIPDGRILAANPAAVRMFGWSEEDITKLGRSGIVDTSDPRLEEAIRVRAATGRFRGELTFKRKDGTTFPGEFTSAIFTDESGHQFTSIIIRDITERKRAEEALRASEERYRALAESITDPFIGMDRSLRHTYWNRAAERFTGITAQEAMGKSLFEIFPQLRGTRTEAAYLQALETGEPHTVETQLPIGGHEHTLEISVYPFADGIYVHVRDITERKQAEEERERLLAQVERHAAELDAIISAIRDGLVIYGPQAEPLRMNDAAVRIFGFTSQEWAATPPAERGYLLRIETSDGRPIPLGETPHDRALRGEPVMGEHIVIYRRDGGGRNLLVSAGPIRDPQGSVTSAVVDFSDITSLVELQQQREDILRAVSHDLRNPLGGILGTAQLCERRLANAGMDRERQSALTIIDAARRMNTLIQDLVDAARSESGQLDLRREAVDLRAFALDLKERLATSLETGRIAVEIPEGIPPACADPDRLERILTNLWSNALKYSAPGTPVEVTARQEDGQVITAVTDHGPGIPPEDIPRLFERYFRAPTAKEAREGLGLGLYITRRLVEAHGGRIWVESQVGQGSTFSFSLRVGDETTGKCPK